MKKSIFFILATLCLNSLAFANGVDIFGRYVKEIGVHDSGNLMIKLNGTQAEFDNLNYTACSNVQQKEFEFILNPQSPMLKEMYATALLAHANSRKIYVWISGCVNIWDGFVVRPKVTAIKIVPN